MIRSKLFIGMNRFVRLLPLLAVAACAPRIVGYNDWVDKPGQIVGDRTGYSIEVQPGSLQQQRMTVITVVRVFDDGGLLGLCGAMVAAAPSQKLLEGEFADFFRDRNSTVTLGEKGREPVLISARFMRLHQKVVSSGVLDPESIDMNRLQGNCVTTKLPWRDDLKAAHHLDLVKTTTTPRSVPIYTYQRR